MHATLWKTAIAGSLLTLCSITFLPQNSLAQRGGRGGGGGGGGLHIGGGGGGGGNGVGGGGGVGVGGGINIRGGGNVGGGVGAGAGFRAAPNRSPGIGVQGPGVGARIQGGNRILNPGANLGVGARAGVTTRSLGGNVFVYGNRNFALGGARYSPAFSRYPWYRGSWYGNYGWGSGYRYGYRPFGWGLGAWGLGALYYNSGYLGYYNPYYNGYGSAGWNGGYNYSQPIPVAYDPSNMGDSDPCRQTLNAAVDAFRQNDYDAALNMVNRATPQCSQDAVMHEFRALVLFAKGDYRNAAATINALLAVGPGWDWATMSSLYPSVDVYTTQLRALEAFGRAHPDDGSAAFLLGYHYMTAGHQDAAKSQFQKVAKLVPNDRVTSELLRMIAPSGGAPAGSPTVASSGLPGTAPSGQTALPPGDLPPGDSTGQPEGQPLPAAPPPTTGANHATTTANAAAVDPRVLVGKWNAKREDGSEFELALQADGTFQWKFTQKGQPQTTFTGKYSVVKNVLALERKEGGALIGEVSQIADGRFNFRLVGAPAQDKGLDFSH